jgi:glycosyltransferase involved in cell wall biosynthesis
VHEYLLQRGWNSRVLFAPLYWLVDPPLLSEDVVECSAFQPGDMVIFQKVNGPKTCSVLEAMKARGVATVYVDCDLPIKLQEARRASITVCSSEYLAAEYRRSGIANVRYIPDAYEWTGVPKDDRVRKQLRCVWFGNATPEKWAAVEELRCLLAATSNRWKIVTVADDPRSDIRWHLGTARRSIMECDAAVLPASDGAEAFAKSSNKAVQAMALGLPVVASPIPAYREVIHSGRNGFLCATEWEWVRALRALEHPETLARISRCAYRFARRYFSIDRIGPLWESVLAETELKASVAVPGGLESSREMDFKKLLLALSSRATDDLANRVRWAYRLTR